MNLKFRFGLAYLFSVICDVLVRLEPELPLFFHPNSKCMFKSLWLSLMRGWIHVRLGSGCLYQMIGWFCSGLPRWVFLMNLRFWFNIAVPSCVVCDILLLLECYSMLSSPSNSKTKFMLRQTRAFVSCPVASVILLSRIIVSSFLFVVLLYGPICFWIYWWMCLKVLWFS